MGRAWKTTLSDGESVTNQFLSTGELWKTFGARAYPVEYGYDYAGRMQTLKTWTNYAAATGAATTTWKFDSYRGFLTNKVYQGSVGPSYTYTAAGRLRTRSWYLNGTATYTNNAAGELQGIAYNASYAQYTPAITVAYSRLGQPQSVTHGTNFTVTLAYNDTGQLLSESYSGGPLSGITVSNRFNNLSQRDLLKVLGVPNATLETEYAYENGRMKTVTSGTNSVEYSYWPNSMLSSNVVFRNGSTVRMTTSRTFDGFGRLTGISSVYSVSSVVAFAYAYNPANQRTAVTNADNSRWDFGYDSLGQVTSGKKRWADNSLVGGQQFEYAYDDIGNRRTYKWGGDTNGANLRQTTYTVNLLNQATTHANPGYAEIIGEADTNAAVKVNGQAASRHGRYFAGEAPVNNTYSVWLGITNVAVASTNAGSETYTVEVGHLFVPPASQTISTIYEGCLYADSRWSYRWDAENRLVKMTAASAYVGYPYQELRFGHDWMSRRISKVVSNKVSGTWYLESSHKFLYDGWNLVAELDGSNVLQRTHVWGTDASGSMRGGGGVGGLLATIIHSGGHPGVYFPAYDGNHNVVAYVSAATGAVVAEYEYGPFGELLRATGPMSKEFTFLFSTKYYDWETCLYYYGYRYYNPTTGRWLSRDPMGEIQHRNTRGENLYSFCGNDGVDYWDYLGLWRGGEHKDMTSVSFSSAWNQLKNTMPCSGKKVLDIITAENIAADAGAGGNEGKHHYLRGIAEFSDVGRQNYSDHIAAEADEYAKLLQGKPDRSKCVEALKKLGHLSHAWQDYYGHAIGINSPFWGNPGPIEGDPDNPSLNLKPASWGSPSNWGEHGQEEPAWRESDYGLNRTRKAEAFVTSKFSRVLKNWLDKCQCHCRRNWP